MINALNDSSLSVRMTGAIAIQQLHDTSYVPYLRDAANREGDETAKHALTEALNTLDIAKKQQPAALVASQSGKN